MRAGACVSGDVRGLANSWLPGCDEEVKRELSAMAVIMVCGF